MSFHKIGGPSRAGWDTWFYIPETTFLSQLGYLHEHHWQVIDVETFLGGVLQPDNLPERSALLTFDDGYRSMRDVALPLLRRFAYPAVLFVPTDFIGGTNSFDVDNEPEEAICDWEDLRRLDQCGVSIQSHGVSHRAFSQLGPMALQHELQVSKAVLEDGLEKVIEVFAYPYGDRGVDTQPVRSLLEEAGYKAACLYGGGPIRLPIDNPYHLKRVPMGPDTNLESELEQVPSHE